MINNIEFIYQRKRDRKKVELEYRKALIYKDNEELQEMDIQVKLLNLELTRQTVLGNVKEQEVAKIKLDEMLSKRTTYMQDNEINPLDLKLRYECEICKDTGYVERQGNFEKCSCLKSLQNQLRYRRSNLIKRVESENFQKFNIEIFDNKEKFPIAPGVNVTQREQMEMILEDVQAFIKEFDEPETKSLIFYGGTGLGKSFLCSAIAKDMMDRGKSVIYHTSNELVQMMEMYTFNKENFFKEHIIEDYRDLDEVELLIIDDLGAELTNNFVRTSLFNILNSRILKKKKTLISTNLSPEELAEKYEERIFSRLIVYTEMYKFVGQDLRW